MVVVYRLILPLTRSAGAPALQFAIGPAGRKQMPLRGKTKR